MIWTVDSILFLSFQYFLALVLLAAAVPKLRQADEFHGVVANYRILPDWLVPLFARLLPWVELLCACGLLFVATATHALLIASGLLVMFSVAVAVNLLRGRTHIDCGCLRGTARGSGINWYHAIRPLMLACLALAAVASMRGNAITTDPAQIALGILAATMAAILYLAAEKLAALSVSSSSNT